MARGISSTGIRITNVSTQLIVRVQSALPEGRPLPEAVWRRRHRGIVALLWLHAIGIVCFGALAGYGFIHNAIEGGVVAAAALFASMARANRRVQAAAASLGLLTASAILVHLSGGYIELHFHFFVALMIIALYQDWVPFLLAIGYVVLEHGTLGVLDPTAVYNHPDGWAHPWKWAAIHGVFVLAASVASVLSWRLNEAARAHTELILNSAGEGIVGLDLHGRIAFVNPAAARMLGWAIGDLIGQGLHSRVLHLPSEASPAHTDAYPVIQALIGGTVHHEDAAVFWRRDGTWFPVEYVSTPIRERGALVGAVITFKDITQRRQMESALREGEERYRRLVENSPEAIAVHSEGRFVYINPAGAALFGAASPAEFIGTQVLDVVHPEYHEEVKQRVRQIQEQQLAAPLLEEKLLRLDGTIIYAEVIGIPTTYHGKVATQIVARDITARKAVEAQLAYQAFHDPLTALPNRALFLDRLDRALLRSARHQTQLAVLFLDLDRFKVINDSLGHAAGDHLLVQVAQRLQACIRTTDTVARLGGDEFTILLDDTSDLAGAVQIAERIVAALAAPFTLNGHELFITTSIGIVLSTPGQDSSDDLMRNADIAMYQAKAQGKARYEVFNSHLNAQAMARLRLEADLRRAIERGEFVIYYQPQIDLVTGQMQGLEALVRWEHSERGLIAPVEFIPVAEETGLIRPLGQWVLAEACRQVQEWSARYPSAVPAVLSVNLSAQQVNQPGFVDEVAGMLARTGFEPRRLQLEITESVIMNDAPATLVTLRALKELGVQLAIDDFGTGYSSLSYLKRFPVDVLKIDRTFVTGLGYDAEDTAIVQAIITLANTLGLHVTAEGVESAAQLAQLQALGCQLGQGYYFAKPLSCERVGTLLANGVSSSAQQTFRHSVGYADYNGA
jgi:diguanylate cyclase (GGDEF)-like protein/PAS domain S-box-containing protein